MPTKLYPFSAKRYAHDIVLLKNHLYLADQTETPLWDEVIETLQSLTSYPVCWLTGKQYERAMKFATMGQEIREACNRK